MQHSDFKKWMTEAGVDRFIALAQACDDLAEGGWVCPESGFDNASELVFKLRCIGLKVDFYDNSELEIQGSYPFFAIFDDAERTKAKDLYQVLLGSLYSPIMGGQQ